MKTVQSFLIGCRVLAVALGLTLVGSGCGDSGGGVSIGVPSAEEIKRDAETRKAMEEASRAASKAPKKH